MARTLDQILSEVSSKSDAQRQAIMGQVADLPNQQAAQEQSLDAQLKRGYDNILSGARRRGLGFSGIPLGEQAEFNATEYAPAVANLKSSFNARRGSLDSALADIGRQDFMTANDLFNSDRSFAESQRQFNEQMRMQQENARRSAASSAAANADPFAKYGIDLNALLTGGAPQQGDDSRYQAYLASKSQPLAVSRPPQFNSVQPSQRKAPAAVSPAMALRGGGANLLRVR